MDSIGPISPLEPVQPLDAYFQTLGDFSSALATFKQLADSVSVSNDWDSEGNSVQLSSASSSAGSLVSFASPSSPGGQSSASSVNCCASCTSHWPNLSANAGPPAWHQLPNSSASSTTSTTSSHSSSGSNCCSGISSLSGFDDYDQEQSNGGRRRGSATGEGRRRRNATAAERYRKRLKGRRSGLTEELELEQERNRKLRQSLEAKLVLYREFADLLAENTRDERLDGELANIGARSLANILQFIWPPNERLADQQQRLQLENLLAHFERLQRAGARLL